MLVAPAGLEPGTANSNDGDSAAIVNVQPQSSLLDRAPNRADEHGPDVSPDDALERVRRVLQAIGLVTESEAVRALAMEGLMLLPSR